jgi:nucleoside-triphosphatase THEP1
VIFIISGGVGAGKTSFLRKVASRLGQMGVPLSGFRSERVSVRGELRGYDLVDLASGKRTEWLRRGEAGERIGPYAIVPEGRRAGERIFSGSPSSSLLAVDELGPAELEGRGFWPSLRPLLRDEGRSFLFVVRTSCFGGFKKLLAGRRLTVFRVGGSWTPSSAAREILAHVRQG